MNQETVISYIINYLRDNGPSLLRKFFLGVLVFVAFYIISKKIVGRVKHRIEANSLQSDIYAKKISQLVGSMIFILLMIFTVLAVFQVIWFEVALIMWWISLGLWFAMETIISNMIAWVFLMTNQKIKLWDFVKFMWSMKMMWTIEEINIRYTVISTFDKRRVIVPNSIVAKTPIQTYKSEPLVRGEIAFRLPRHSHVQQVRDIMTTIINAHKAVTHKDYTNILITWFDKFGTSIKSYFFVDQTIKGASAFIVWRDLKGLIFDEFKKYGISVPYEHITLTTE